VAAFAYSIGTSKKRLPSTTPVSMSSNSGSDRDRHRLAASSSA
jgi:hypothetical protein